MTLKEPCREFEIPPRTLKKRINNNNTLKGRIQPTSVLGVEAEKKIVAHVIKLQKHGFSLSPSRRDLREMAFQSAEQLQVQDKFDKEKHLAGYDWLEFIFAKKLIQNSQSERLKGSRNIVVRK
jgi:hypothetical protein